MNDDMEDVLREFLEESRESIDLLDRDLVLLEKTPDASELVARIFRAVHTIKGTCGFLGFGRLEAVTHAGENVLSALREHSLEITPNLTSVLLSTVDAIREMLGISLVNLLADRQPHVDEYEHATEHMQPM